MHSFGKLNVLAFQICAKFGCEATGQKVIKCQNPRGATLGCCHSTLNNFSTNSLTEKLRIVLES